MALHDDLRFALRSLAKRPGFSIVVVLILGLGMGAVTAVVDLTNLLAWRLVPVEKPEELTRVYTGNLRGFSGPWGFTSYADYLDYRTASNSLDQLAAHREVDLRFDNGDITRKSQGSSVSDNYFQTLGLEASLGRVLGPQDGQVGAAPAIVLAHHFWQQMGADPDVVGTSVKLEDIPFTVVGVGPEGHKSNTAGSVLNYFMPIELLDQVEATENLLTDRNRTRFYLTGRRAEGMSLADIQSEFSVIAKGLDAEFPLQDDKARNITSGPARLAHPIDLHRSLPSLRLFGLAVLLLLAITCANIAHLLLARSASRRQEMAVRQSLGAPRFLIVRQLLIENFLLAAGGGLLGLLLAFWGRASLSFFSAEQLASEMRFDYRVLTISFGVCLLTTLLFGLAPALTTSRVEWRSALSAATAGGGGGRGRVGAWLAGAQVALSVLLLVAGGLLGQSLLNRLHADLGFDDQNLLIAAVNLPPKEYSTEAGRQFHAQFRERATAIPGVEQTASALLVPPLLFDISLPFRLAEETESKREARINFISESYFDTMRISLERGRGFRSSDDAESLPVVIVNRAMADQLWPGEDPIGRGIEMNTRDDEAGPRYEVIGVVSNVDQFRASFGGEPLLYFSNSQRHRPRQQLVMRSSADPEAVFGALREILREMDPGLALTNTRSGEENRREAYTFERMQASAVAVFAGAGLLLSVIGLFAVLSYDVSRRIRTIGIRLAIGARDVDIRNQVVGRGLKIALFGGVAGLLALIPAARFLDGLLFGVKVGDLAVLASVFSIVLLTAFAAAFLPARRASKLDPLIALRHE